MRKTVLFLIPLALAACSAPEPVVFDAPATSSTTSSSATRSSSEPITIDISSQQTKASSSSPDSPVSPDSRASSSRPPAVTIRVPFATQAPFANWDMPYQEACEEASLTLVNAYLDGSAMTPAIMDKAILDMVAWQESRGMPADIDAAGMVKTATEHLGKNATVRYDIAIEDIEAELAKGNPVILPLAGRDIGNPYYSGEGPWYHVLVVTGYDGKNFITNDVGTKRGEGYKYHKDVLYDAIHDWTGRKEEIRSGRKAMVVVTK
jgi:hypothetical protein